MRKHKRGLSNGIKAQFNTYGRRPPVNLKEAFERAHRIPKMRMHFQQASADRLKATYSKPQLTLTPMGAKAVRGAARISVAEKGTQQTKLPRTLPKSRQPVTKQFNIAAGRHRIRQEQQRERES